MVSLKTYISLLKKNVEHLRARRKTAALVVGVCFLFVNVCWAAAFFFRPSYERILDSRSISLESGNAYLAHLENPSFLYGMRGDEMGAASVLISDCMKMIAFSDRRMLCMRL